MSSSLDFAPDGRPRTTHLPATKHAKHPLIEALKTSVGNSHELPLTQNDFGVFLHVLNGEHDGKHLVKLDPKWWAPIAGPGSSGAGEEPVSVDAEDEAVAGQKRKRRSGDQ